MLIAAYRTGRVAPILISGFLVLSLAAFGFLLFRHVQELRAAASAQIAQEIDEESKTFCRKFGFDPETVRHAECADDLSEIRRRHQQRIAGDVLGVH